jgi:glutamine synthetase
MVVVTGFDHDALAAEVAAGRIDTVVVAFADHQGRLVGKRADAVHYLERVRHDGLESCDYLIACDLDDVPLPGLHWASYEQGYGDMLGTVDASTLRVIPWLPRTALVLVDLFDERTGAPVEESPRRILQRQVERAAELGLEVWVGTEIEFYLYEETYAEAAVAGFADLTPSSPHLQDYSILQTTPAEDVLGDLRRGLRAAGAPVEFSKGEAGRGQHEVNITHRSPVETADLDVLFKHAVKEIAGQRGRSATFMAKPVMHEAGSGCHVHVSIHREGRPADDREFGSFLAGLVATAADLSLLVAPNVNSYRRFQPESWAPTGIAWALDNRTVGFRVVGHGSSRRVENRIPGADANPYLAIAATLAGGLHGVERGLEPLPPFTGNGYSAPELPRVPTTFVEAIERWRASEVVPELFGEAVRHHVLGHAEAEWRAFSSTVTDWERRRYFERI